MKYSSEIVINVPLMKVIEYFDNLDNMKHWQEGYVSHEFMEGKEGQPGAKTKLYYKMGKREINMIETITQRDLPREFSATYETKGVWNEIKNFFTDLGDGKTKWRTNNEFKFSGLFMKAMGLLMPGAFKKQSYKYLVDFKKFAENRFEEEKK